jgi:diacylglycerol kinase family enzyme
VSHANRPLAAFVVNGLRVRDVPRLRRSCAAAAAASGWAAPLMLTTSLADSGSGAASHALECGAAMVFAVGGDGTVRACAEALAGTQVPLAIIAAGSANLTARALGIPARPNAALEVGFRGRDRRIDLASADGMTCTAMAGIGVDAAVVGATLQGLKKATGWPAYAAAAAGQLRHPAVTFSVRLDGADPLIRQARSVAVGNCGLLPGGFPIMPDARLDDGFLDVAILAPSGPVGWASVGYRVVLQSRRDDRQLERHRARRVEIRAAADLPRQVDGEVIAAASSLTVTVRAHALLVRVPPVTAPASAQVRRGRRPG